MEYDVAGNATRLVDGRGAMVEDGFDDANRLTTRTVTPAAGVERTLSETFA